MQSAAAAGPGDGLSLRSASHGISGRALSLVVSLVRPVVWRRAIYEQERARARELVARHGDSSLDFFKTSEDKLYFFSSTGRAVVAFGVANGAAIALGDPVAASDDDFLSVLRELLAFCECNGWHAAFYQVPPRRLDAYRALGLHAIKVGEDAVVDLNAFSLSGRSFKSLRSEIHRLERDGYGVRSYEPPQPRERLAELGAISAEWLRIGGHRERRFTFGDWDAEYVRASRVFAVEDAQGKPVAFANLIPDGVAGEATVDLMRRREQPPGAMNLLFVRMFEQLRSEGYRRFSLGMAPFANVGVGDSARVPERIIHQMYQHLNRVFSFQGLRAYKNKFHPNWEPRYLVYGSDVALPSIALAIVRLTE